MKWATFVKADAKLKLALIVTFILVCIIFAYTSDYNLATGSGNLCMLLFIVSNSYVPVKRLRLFFMLKDQQGFFTKFVRIHCWLNTGMFVAGCIHCYVTRWHNIYLWISLVIMGWLVLGGFIMRFKYQATVRKGLYILHTQQFMFYILCFCLLKGHYVF